MTNEEYLKLFQNIENNNYNNQNLNETSKNDSFENLNEININNYKLDEQLNDGWNINDFKIESRVNGVLQQKNSNSNSNPYQHQRRRNSLNLNGLDQFIDDGDDDKQNINEVYGNKKSINIENEQININNIDVVTIEMFEKMNTTGLLSLHQRVFKS